MNAFGKSTGGIEALLQKPDVKLEEVLDHKDLGQEFRRQNPALMKYLLSVDTMKDLVNMLITAKKREDHKKVHQLFLTSNTQLHRVFATKLEIADIMFQALDNDKCTTPEEKSNRSYAAGTLSRLLSRAVDTWPECIAEVFRSSETIFPLIIKNLDRRIVLQSMSDLMTESHKEVVELLWHIWMVMSGKDTVKKEERPRKVFLIRDYDQETLAELRKSFTMAHKVNAIELLKQFFWNSGMEAMNSFAILIFKWIISLDDEEFIPRLYELAKVITEMDIIHSDEFVQKTVNKVLDADLEKDHMYVVPALYYLTSVRKYISAEDKQKLVAKVYWADHYSQFAMIHATELMKKCYIKPKKPGQEPDMKIETIDLADPQGFKAIIINCWNMHHDKNGHPGDRNFCGSCIEAAKLLKEHDENIWQDSEMDSAIESWKIWFTDPETSEQVATAAEVDFGMTLEQDPPIPEHVMQFLPPTENQEN